MNTLTKFLADARSEHLRRDAQSARTQRAALDIGRSRRAVHDVPITIRHGGPDDEIALIRLAALDSADVPDQPILLAEVCGELLAALSLSDGATVADPFHRTAAIVELLETWRAGAHPSERARWPAAVLRPFRRRARGARESRRSEPVVELR
jgi:hypothetical protein